MAYDLYLGNWLMPVTPSSVTMAITNQNRTVVQINDGEINLLKRPGLTDISFTLLLPNVLYPFAKYTGGFRKADHYLNYLKQLKEGKKPFQFIMARHMGLGNQIKLFDTNLKVSLEDYHIKESADNGFDVEVSIVLKQYKDYSTKVVTLVTPLPTAPMVMYQVRPLPPRPVSPSKAPSEPAKSSGGGGRQCNPGGLNSAQVKALQKYFGQSQTGCFDSKLMNACKSKWGSAVGTMTPSKAWSCYQGVKRTEYEKNKMANEINRTAKKAPNVEKRKVTAPKVDTKVRPTNTKFVMMAM